MTPARSVMVTGASGLVGSRVVAELVRERGTIETIVATDVHEAPVEKRLAGVLYRGADIRDGSICDLMREHSVDTVVHLAAVVTPGKNSSRDLEYSIDVRGTRNVLDGALSAGVRHFVYTSSGAAYGYHADNPVPLRESDPLRGNPEFPYSYHKRQVEEMLVRYRGEHPELAQLILRPGTILGEHVATPITAIFDRPVVVGVRDSDSPFVLIWDEDVARCIVKGVREGRTGIYNLAGDGAVALPEIARRLGKPYVAVPASVLAAALAVGHALGLTRRGREQVSFLSYRPVLCNDQLKREFGFTPTYTSEECFEHYRRLRSEP